MCISVFVYACAPVQSNTVPHFQIRFAFVYVRYYMPSKATWNKNPKYVENRFMKSCEKSFPKIGGGRDSVGATLSLFLQCTTQTLSPSREHTYMAYTYIHVVHAYTQSRVNQDASTVARLSASAPFQWSRTVGLQLQVGPRSTRYYRPPQ